VVKGPLGHPHGVKGDRVAFLLAGDAAGRRRKTEYTEVPVVADARLLDRRGYYRSPVSLVDYHLGKEPANKGRKFPPEPLSPREVLGLLSACGRGSCGKRDRALIVVMWRAGLRVSEALALYPKDVDLDDGRIAVLHGKGDRARVVGLDQIACSHVALWFAERKRLGLTGQHPLFCVISRPTKGLVMHSSYVRNKLKELGVRAGIEKRVHPHGLRHTHAFELAGERTDLRLIRRQLGHGNLAVTARYVEHLNPFEVVDAIRARPWPDALSPARPRARGAAAPGEP
jgi:integrase